MKCGSVSVGMVQVLVEGGFVVVLVEIIVSWLWLELDLQVVDSYIVSQKVCQVDLDVGLIFDLQGQVGFSVLVFVELEVGIVMCLDYFLVGVKVLFLGEFSLEWYIVFGVLLIVYEWVVFFYCYYDFVLENIISCNDIWFIKLLVLCGSGVMFFSLFDVLDEVQCGQLVFVLLCSMLL